MAVLNFPDNPTVGQVYEFGAQSWTWDGMVWSATVPSELEIRMEEAEDGIAANASDIVAINANISANYYTKTASDARYVPEISGLVAIADTNLSDSIVVYDASVSLHRKITVQNFFRPYGLQRRNMIDNGGFRVFQRGAGTVAVGNTQAGLFTADRWYTNNGGAGTWDQAVVDVITPKGLRKALRMTCTTADASLAAGDLCVITQGIEGNVLAQAMATTTSMKQLSLTFDCYVSVAGTYIVELLQYNPTLTRQISFAVVLPANTLTTVSIPVPADAAASVVLDHRAALGLQFFLAAGTTYTGGASLNTAWAATPAANTRAKGQTNLAATVNNTWHITEVQLEAGNSTPYEYLSYDDVSRRCLRYFQRWQNPPLRGATSGSIVARAGMALPVRMRDVPVPTYSGTIPFYDGVNIRTVTAMGGNYSPNGSVFEADITVNSAWPVDGRMASLYQNGTAGYVDLSADI